ncbi:MAG: GNAT family N-acetyltransferase [Amphiplicatus sp.]
MGGAVIRKAGAADLAAVDAIERSSFNAVDCFAKRNLKRLLASDSADLLLAECEGRPAGYVLLLFRKGAKAARLYSLATAPDARGKGVGPALVEAAAARAIKRGCDRLRLEVRLSNAAAIGLYERAGFQTLKMTPNYYDDGEGALMMERRLEAERRVAE